MTVDDPSLVLSGAPDALSPSVRRMGALGELRLDDIREAALRAGRLAEAVFGAPEADVIAVEDGRVWRGKPRSAKASDDIARWLAAPRTEILWIADTWLDPQFRDHPGMQPPKGIRFCAAAPIRLRNGAHLGVLRVMDKQPRAFDASLAARLADLAATVADECDRLLSAEVKRMRELFAQAPGFMAILRGPDHIFELVNPGYYELVGRRDVIGLSMCEALPEMAGQGFDLLLDEVIRTGVSHVGRATRVLIARMLGEPPVEAFIDFVYQPIHAEDGSVTGVFCQGYEVTKEKLATDELRASREALAAALRTTQAILDQSLDVICTIDADGVFTRVSKHAEQVWGYRPEELVGRPYIDLVHAEDVAATVAIAERIMAGTPATAHVNRYMHKDGRAVPVMWSATWSDEHQTMFAVAHDMREQVQAEDVLRQAQKMDAVGRLTGGVAHDFNNLLTVIIGGADMLAEQLADNPELHPIAELTLQAAERGAELVKQLLAFSRTQQLALQPVDCAQLLDGLMPILRRTIGSDIEITVQSVKNLRCLADPSQLTSALLNLCINARDAMPGGGRLTLRADHEAPGGAKAGSEPARVALSVEDTGEGMSADTLQHALEPFFTTKPPSKGSGLGLSMVYGLATQSGGELALESELGKGAKVTIFLPQTDQPLASAAPLAAAAAADRSRCILLVEDDDLVRDQVERHLVALGYHVSVRSNGPEALDYLRQHPGADMLMTDIVMPGGMNGHELAAAARVLIPRLKVLMTSGYANRVVDDVDALQNSREFLAKPYRRADLARKLVELFELP
jgi:PAS domain S-box-containing protein